MIYPLEFVFTGITLLMLCVRHIRNSRRAVLFLFAFMALFSLSLAAKGFTAREWDMHLYEAYLSERRTPVMQETGTDEILLYRFGCAECEALFESTDTDWVTRIPSSSDAGQALVSDCSIKSVPALITSRGVITGYSQVLSAVRKLEHR